jgi:hypothetical protein
MSTVKAAQDSTAASTFFITLLNAATVAHTLHLKEHSFSRHMALNTLYTELPESVDELIEAWQGRYGLVTDYPAQTVITPADPLVFVTNLRKYVDDNRAKVATDSELQNIIDEIVQLLDSTIYKLTNLA